VLLPWFKFQKSEQNLPGSIAFRDNGAHLLHFHSARFASHSSAWLHRGDKCGCFVFKRAMDI
jgi:hypothetical protein